MGSISHHIRDSCKGKNIQVYRILCYVNCNKCSIRRKNHRNNIIAIKRSSLRVLLLHWLTSHNTRIYTSIGRIPRQLVDGCITMDQILQLPTQLSSKFKLWSNDSTPTCPFSCSSFQFWLWIKKALHWQNCFVVSWAIDHSPTSIERQINV